MFTGIIEEVGKITEIKKGIKSCVLTIQGSIIFHDLQIGNSVAVNGVCLTVSKYSQNTLHPLSNSTNGNNLSSLETFQADVMHETLIRSALHELKIGSPVNLERAMAANGRFGGHIVTGHIDGVGVIEKIQKDDNAVLYTVRAPESILGYVVLKGSIAIDGISLTVTKVTKTDFTVSIIPHTIKSTILCQKSVSDKVNLENDLVGKYIEKLLVQESKQTPKSNLTKEFISKYGF